MLDAYFAITSRGSSLRVELLAGLTTFLSAAYIVAVNPQILSAAGMDQGALVTVTCLAAGAGTLLFALWPRVPLMMAPGMGLNAFFAYTLVAGQKIPWQTALGVVFLSGVLFLCLTLLGVRQRVVDATPRSIRLATAVGIGLFISFIGLKNMGLVIDHPATLVTHGKLTRTALLGLGGLLLIGLLEARRVRGAMLLGILGVTAAGIATGEVKLPGRLLAWPRSIAPIALQLDIRAALAPSLWAAVFSFMFLDLFDSLGTLMGVSAEAGLVREDGSIDKIGPMLTADAIATVGGALLGTSTTTTYIESAAGISEGGRTGLTAVAAGSLFLLAMFFWPLVLVIPPWATAPALVVVGVFMMKNAGELDFTRIDEGLPAFLTIVLMPLTFSISQGILFGFLSYVLLKLALGKTDELNPMLYGIAALSVVNLVAGA